MNFKIITLVFCSTLYSLGAQESISTEGLVISLISRIESLENRVRFLEEQLMAQARVSSNSKAIQSTPKVIQSSAIKKKIKYKQNSGVSITNYESFFIKNVIQTSWRVKQIDCKPDFVNNKVECTAVFRVIGKVGRKARQVVKGLVLLNPNQEPLRVFKF